MPPASGERPRPKPSEPNRPDPGEDQVPAIQIEDVKTRLRSCFDPEIPVNIYDLGLVYDIRIEGDEVNIKMSFTSMECPSARAIPAEVQQRVGEIEGVRSTNIDIVWDPPWHPRMISPDGKKELGLDEDSL